MGEACEVRCPKCGDQIVKSYLSEVKLRSKVLKWTAKGLFAACRGCGDDVRISTDLLKSIETRFEYEVKAAANSGCRKILRLG